MLGGATLIVAMTLLVAGSMRDTLGPPAFATQTALGDTAIPCGCGPTGITAVTVFVCGSMRATVLSGTREIQTAPSPAAASPQLAGNGGHELLGLSVIWAATALVAGSIRDSVDAA